MTIWANGTPTLVLREGFQVPGLPAGALLKSVVSISLREDAMLALVTLLPTKGLVTTGNDTVLLRITSAGTTLLLREGAPLDLQDGSGETTIKAINTLLPASGSPAHGRWHAERRRDL